MIINNNWYNLQSLRAYPISDYSTGRDDKGQSIRHNFLVDCHLMFPESYGKVAFVSSMTSSDSLVSITFLASDRFPASILDRGEPVIEFPTSEYYSSSSESSSSSVSLMSETTVEEEVETFFPLGIVTLKKPINIFYNYKITPFVDGVGGFVVFGEGTEEATNLKFSTPEQSMVLLRCATPYPDSPVRSLAKTGLNTRLTGLVTLKNSPNVYIEKQSVNINGVGTKDALVFTLQSGVGDNFTDFSGRCGRPDNESCNPVGIKSINGVTPDCNGNIDIIFEGFNTAEYIGCSIDAGYSYGGTHGIGLEVDIGIETVCENTDMRRFTYLTGRDYCEVIEESSSSQSEVLEETLTYGSQVFSVDYDTSAELVANLRKPEILSGTPDAVMTVVDADTARISTDRFSGAVLYPGLGSTDNCWTSSTTTAVINLSSTENDRYAESGGIITNYLMPTTPGYSNHTYLYFGLSALKSSLNIYTQSHEREPRFLAAAFLGKTVRKGIPYSMSVTIEDDPHNDNRVKATVTVAEVGGDTLLNAQEFYNLPAELCGNSGLAALRCVADFDEFTYSVVT